MHSFLFTYTDVPFNLHSFPTRRSSDLELVQQPLGHVVWHQHGDRLPADRLAGAAVGSARADRKSTRLNSSHEWISYAVFCLKKKKDNKDRLSKSAEAFAWVAKKSNAPT